MQHRIIINDLAHIDEAADEFLKAIGSRKLVAFYAPMGAGKTILRILRGYLLRQEKRLRFRLR